MPRPPRHPKPTAIQAQIGTGEDAVSIFGFAKPDALETLEESSIIPTTDFEGFLAAELAKLKSSILKEFNCQSNGQAAFQKHHLDNPNGDNGHVGNASPRTGETALLATVKPQVPEAEEKRQTVIPDLMHSDTDEAEQENKIKCFDRHWTLAHIVESPAFDVVIALVVVVNCLFLCVEAQMAGVELGNQVFGYSNIDYPDDLKFWLEIVDYGFVSVYVFEMVVKLGVLRLKYFMSAWNVLDGMAVVVSGVVLYTGFGMSPALTRVARISKLFRLTHIVHQMVFFESFLVLLRALVASVIACFWSLLFLLMMIVSSAFVMNTILLEHLRENRDTPSDAQLEVFLHFGTLVRTVVTTFEMTLGNWGPPTWLLINHVNEAYGMYMIFYKCTAGFAVLNVINAVFLRLTMKQADAVDNYAVEQTMKDAAKYREKVGKLFDALDTSGDGKISYDEFLYVCECASLKAWMKLLNINTTDLETLFMAIDDGDGLITKQEFLDGFSNLAGYATAVDGMIIKSMIRELSRNFGPPVTTTTVRASCQALGKINQRLSI